MTILVALAVVATAAPTRAAEPPAPPFNHPLGAATKASPLLKGCGLPLFDAKGIRVDQGGIGCGTCHPLDASGELDPGALLGDRSASDLCAACHKKEAGMTGSAHDMEDGCLACHQPHAEDAEDLWTAGLEEDADEDSATCLACHDHPEWASWPFWEVPANRPADTHHPNTTLVRRSTPATMHDLGCINCHNPHAKAANRQLLADGPQGTPATVCLECHRENLEQVAGTRHGPRYVDPTRQSTTICGGCHRIHDPGDALPTSVVTNIPARLGGAFLQRNLLCLACHAVGGGPPQTARNYLHPTVPMPDLEQFDMTGVFPLFAGLSGAHAVRQIGCLTCHLPHGRGSEPDDEDTDDDLGAAGDSTAPTVPLVRRYAEPNLCSTCHPGEALERVLFFHNPSKLPRPWP